MNEQATKVVGRRVAAFIIDALLLTAINFALFFAMKQETLEGISSGELQAGDSTYINLTINSTEYGIYGSRASLYFLITLVIGLGYLVVWQGLKGVTVGKLMTGIKVVKDSDPTQPPGIGRAIARWFLFIADAFPYLIPYLTGFLVALNSKQNKRIGDMVAGTLVVKKDADLSAAPADTAPPPGIPFQEPQPPA